MDEKINGIQLSDEGLSTGKPVVFVHGFPFTRRMWQPQIQALLKTHRVISFDVRGHGQSEVGDGQYSLEFFVDDLILVLDHLKIKSAALCGLSMGGYIALRAVERHPERFDSLILCDTKAEADSSEAKIKRAAGMRSVKKNGVEAFANEFVKAVLSEGTLKTRPEVVAQVLGLIRQNTPLGIAGTLLALAARTDTTAALPKMNQPTLILVGEEDKVTPPSASEAMQKALPQATLHVIPGAGHLSNLENPVVFNEKLLNFLNRG